MRKLTRSGETGTHVVASVHMDLILLIHVLSRKGLPILNEFVFEAKQF